MIDKTDAVSAVRTKLLLVEDDAGVRRSLQLLLRGRGYDVRAYATGRQMLADPRSIEAACLITDYRMDEMDGLDVLRGLRDQGWHQPAILITAHHAADLVRAAREAGFDTILEKPLQDHVLVENVARTTRPS
ncbi:response regulator transcription factor [Sphingomonas abietis]|uniref:Response regulator n=1 Tax=Sphingomonas abietis TaxID=3012344 RepID=A0ABY7NSD4_9SPHN|nr:response regulator [Sphingomonas abietis]WBO24288.1 response regulator [Sphingomonas abietis]WBO24410.1 response regulator [Sphingomonas abietis]